MDTIRSYVNSHKRELVFGAILFFVASLSFALGCIASRQFDHAAIIIEKCSA